MLTATSSNPDAIAPDAALLALGSRARAALARLGKTSATDRTTALVAVAQALRQASPEILAANTADVSAARAAGQPDSLLDRLALDQGRLDAMARGIEETAALPDPVGVELARWSRPNGLEFRRVSVPLGVIGVIFEARPNVAADAGALCLRAGNAVVLRGGSDSTGSVQAIVAALRAGLSVAGLPADAIQAVPTADRAAVGAMLAGLGGALDVIVPRGGKSLVARVHAEARVPVFAHLEGLCHTYIHTDADLAKTRVIVANAKMRRVSVCGATETLLIDQAVAPALLPLLAQDLRALGCALRGDAAAQAIVAMDPATEEDWRTEYLAPILSIRVVADLNAAMAHIATYGSGHTDAIVTENTAAAETFLAEVDSAIVLHNASTQFADGGEFGFGGEIGIATGRMHARGPVGAAQLTTFKYTVRGTGQTRP